MSCREHNGQFNGYFYVLRDASTADIIATDKTLVAEVGFAGLAPCQKYEFKVAFIATGLQSSYSPWLMARTDVAGKLLNVSVLKRELCVFLSFFSPKLFYLLRS